MLPKTVRIGAVGYTVKVMDDLHKVDDDGRKMWLHGHIRLADSELRVANDQSADIKVVTLWHEILHGILYNAGQSEQPEPLIEAFSFGIVQLLRDNPDLIMATVDKSETVSAGNE